MSGARLALTLCVTKAREGSEADLHALELMFQRLGFESTMKKDPTAQVLCSQPQANQGGAGPEGGSKDVPESSHSSHSSNSWKSWRNSSMPLMPGKISSAVLLWCSWHMG